LFSCSSSSINVASSMIGLSGGVAIVARWPPNRSPLLPPPSPLHANARARGPVLYPGVAPVVNVRHRPAPGRPVWRTAAANARLFHQSRFDAPSSGLTKKKPTN
jgi:hypothetical protein